MYNKKILITFLLLIFTSLNIYGVGLSGSYNVGAGQVYTSLTGRNGLFEDVNQKGLAGNVNIYITSDLVEDGRTELDQWNSIYTLTISPSSATERLISGSINSVMIRLDGADKVTIDGRYSGSGKYLRFRNTHGSFPVISFINDACYNTITYCIIESNNINTSSATASGTIIFGTTTGTTGNDFNIISYCDIRDRSDASGFPAYAIYSSGNTTSTKYNTDNSILNNNIYNFWKDGAYSSGIYLTTGTGTNWTISDNNFYQTSARLFTLTSVSGWNVIWINSTSINGINISNNHIGGSDALCGGNPWSYTANNYSSQFSAIRLSAGSAAAASVNGNQVANINISTSTITDGELTFSGILCLTGLVNVGDLSGNDIGDELSTNSIRVAYTGTGANSQIIRGIDHRATGTIANNIIGSFTISGTLTDSVTFDAISMSGAATGNLYITNNTIGSTTIANSIQSTTASLITLVNGINVNKSGSSTVNITGNTISNLNNGSTNNNSRIRGIYIPRGTTPGINISNNIVCKLSTTSSSILLQPNVCAAIGIMSGTNSTVQTISGNTIFSIGCTSNNNTCVIGLAHTEQNGIGTISGNRIYGLTNSSTSASPSIYGIDAYWGNWTYVNNQISLTNGEILDNTNIISLRTENQKKSRYEITTSLPQLINDKIPNEVFEAKIINNINAAEFTDKHYTNNLDISTNGVIIQGFHDEAATGGKLYFNSIYVGGEATSGNANSFAYVRPLTDWPTPVTLRNNILCNKRSGGSGNHFAIGNEVNPPTNNWNSTTSNYNLFISPNANVVGEWGLGIPHTINQWRASSSGDLKTWSGTSGAVSVSSFFVNLAEGNLNINSSSASAWYINGKGEQVASVTTDFSGNFRSNTIASGAPDIGSSEVVPSNTPISAMQTGPIGAGLTSTFIFANRTLATITWGTTGTLPSSLSFDYYSGTNPPNNVPSSLFSNAYWQINAIGGSDFSYSITFYYDVTIQGTVPAETNIRLAKSNDGGLTWQAYLNEGTGAGQYQLNTTNKTITVYGLTSFSLFTLTDNSFPLPVTLTSFDASINGRDIKLSWSTSSEINNKGFEVERKMSNKSTASEWNKIGFIEGAGTSNTIRYYSFNDNKLNTAVYQYRLKQLDFNGNYEYFELLNPREITIGAPNIFDMFQNYPNPSNPVSKIDFQIPTNGYVSIRIYDISGKETVSLIDKQMESGYHSVKFDGTNLSSGIYFYRINFSSPNESFNKTMKLILIK